MGWIFQRMFGIMWNAWSLEVYFLNVKKVRSQDSQARMSDKVERVPHEEEGVMRLQR